MVYLFQNGQLVDGFEGLQLEEVICVLLDKVLFCEEELKVQQVLVLMQEEKYVDVLLLLKEVWQLLNQESQIGLLLVEMLIVLYCFDEVESVLKIIFLQDQDIYYQGLVVQIELFKQVVDILEIQQLQQQVEQNLEDVQLVFQLVLQLYQVGCNEEVLVLLFSYLQKDLGVGDGQVCKMLQEIFVVFGIGDVLVVKYCCQFYLLLY